uniref:VWFD domain-containing protein n=1 Tax=Callorhinchus milii TaxID=7868 RepID=A0A4W3H0Q5_CALMI
MVTYTWGRGAYRTFHDRFYHFTSNCNYVLSRQCKGGADFNIQIRRDTNGNLEHMSITIEGVLVIVEDLKITCIVCYISEQPVCTEGQIYKECGPACLPTCSDPKSHQHCDQCVNTCVCPEGTVRDDTGGTNQCIPKAECPCEYSGTIYQSGDERTTSCQSCTCKSGIWSCSQLSCPGRCKIEQGSHITTFDNSYYTMIGDCSFSAVLVCEITIFQQSSMYLQVATEFGLKMQVQFSPIMQLYISVPEDAKGSTKGLCGTFNDNASDDFRTIQGIVEDSAVTFANSWKTGDKCPDPTLPSPCISSENEKYAKQHCSLLRNSEDVFAACHPAVDYIKYYEVTATCACEDINDCLCAGLGAYAHECAANGIIVKDWGRDICDNVCTNNQEFDYDMRACNRSCRLLPGKDFTCDIQDVPVSGCGCPEGLQMNKNGDCVEGSDCPCYVGDMIIKIGQSKCSGGKVYFDCSNLKPNETYCKKTFVQICISCFLNGKYHLVQKLNFLLKQSDYVCVNGCFCPDGSVEDDSGHCINADQCPCFFGGNKYNVETAYNCFIICSTCKAGSWDCSEKPCPKTCQVYGDGHHITFDGKRYTYDGNCEYIFVKVSCNQKYYLELIFIIVNYHICK